MPFELGNTLGKRQRYVSEAIKRAVVQDKGKKLRALVDAQLQAAADGDLQAAIFIRDTLDGRPAQSTELSVTGSLVETLASIRMATLPTLPEIPALGRVIDHDTGDTDG